MKKDHRIELEKAIQNVQIAISHLSTELVFLRRLAEKRERLDESYLEVSKEFRKLAKAIEDSVNGVDEDE